MKDKSDFSTTFTYQRPFFNIIQQKQPVTFEWTIQEDMKLIELCNQYKHQWARVATKMKNKDPRQCNYRYKKLSAKYFQRKFNRIDDVTLISLVDKYGTSWNKIESHMQGYNKSHLKERYEQIILPKRLNYSSQEEIRYQTEEIHIDCFDKSQCEVTLTEFPNQYPIGIQSCSEVDSDLPDMTLNNSTRHTNIISNQQFVNKTYLSLFTKYHQRLNSLSIQIKKEYRYYQRTINNPVIKKLKIYLETINSEIKASSSMIRKMKAHSLDNNKNFFENSLTLMTRSVKAIKISQLLLKFFRKMVKEI